MRRCLSRPSSQMECGFIPAPGPQRKRRGPRMRTAAVERRGGEHKCRYPWGPDPARRDDDPCGLAPECHPAESNCRRGSRFLENVPRPPGSPTAPGDNRSVAPSPEEVAARREKESYSPSTGCESKAESENGNY